MNRKVLFGSVMILVFLSLTIVLGTLPVWAEEVGVTHTTLEDFNAGSLFHTGLTRIDDGEVQLLVVGLAGDWITNTNTTGLPALARHTAVYKDDHIIVAGGMFQSEEGSNEVYHSTIDLYTHDLADWQQTTSLPASEYSHGVFWHASVVVHDKIYILGGRDNGGVTAYNKVAFATIQPDGSVGSWQMTTPLPEALAQMKAVVVADRIYVLGGALASGAQVDTIYMATPHPTNGDIASWTTLPTTLPHNVAGHMAASFENHIYMIGGVSSDLAGFSPYVDSWLVDPTTGLLGSWTRLTNLPINLFGGAGLAFNGALFTTGGADNNQTTPSGYVRTNLIYEDGSIGSWGSADNIDPARFYHATVNSRDGWLYIINGSDGTKVLQEINRGATAGVGEQYAPDGTFTSAVMDLTNISKLVKLEWNTTIPDPAIMDVTIEFRTKLDEIEDWSAWQGPFPSSSTPGTVTSTRTLDRNARYVQYRVYMATDDTQQTPALNAVRLTYEKPIYAVNVTKDSDPEPGTKVYPGDVISYTLIYSNGFQGITATNTTVADELPLHTSYVPGSIFGPGANDTNPDLLRWSLGDLDPGETGEVGFAVRVDPELEQSTMIENLASISSNQGPKRLSNKVSHWAEVFYNIDIAKDASPPHGSEVSPGDHIAYTLTYTNSGVRAVTQGVITDTYDPSGCYNVLVNQIVPAPDEGNNLWLVPDLPVGGSNQIELVVQVADIVMPNHWPISNQASFDTDQVGPAFSELVTHTVVLPPAPRVDLVVKNLTWTPSNPVSGQPVTFRAVVANQGTLAADNTQKVRFYTELYIKPKPSQRPDGPSDHDGSICVDNCTTYRYDYAQDIASLGAGAQVDADFENLLGNTDALPAGEYDVYVQVDMAYTIPGDDNPYNPYWGLYPEEWESNNIYHTTIVIDPADDWGGRVFVPIIFKRH